MSNSSLFDTNIAIPSPMVKVYDPFLAEKEITLYMKRDDLINPKVSGNKWRKIKYNLEQAIKKEKDTIVTFGGAYSNHIPATAAAGYIFGVKTIGIIRGEEHLPLNDSLSFAAACGMRLHYMDRETYRNKNSEEVQRYIHDLFGKNIYVLPEGGSNTYAVHGCAEIIREIGIPFDVICCACGTGGTLAGLIVGLNQKCKAIGFPALKGGEFLYDDIHTLIKEVNGQDYRNWRLETDYHFGGYAKKTNELVNFIKTFHVVTGIELDFVYTGKMMFGIYDLIHTGYFEKGDVIVAVHTGGLPNGSVLYNQSYF